MRQAPFDTLLQRLREVDLLAPSVRVEERGEFTWYPHKGDLEMPNPSGYLANIGLALPGMVWNKLLPAADNVNCPANTTTTIATATLQGTDSGLYVVWFFAVITMAFGASLPTGIVFTANILGSNDTHSPEANTITQWGASSTQQISMLHAIDLSLAPDQLRGPTTVNYKVNPTAQAVTIRKSAAGFGTQILVVAGRLGDGPPG